MDLNKVMFIGNLTHDPETRTTQSGQTVTNFSLAVNERRGQEQQTLFLRVSAWGKTGELCQQYLTKGCEALVEGRLRIDEYTAKDGQKRRDPLVLADRVSFGRKPDAARASEPQAPPAQQAAAPQRAAGGSDDMPF